MSAPGRELTCRLARTGVAIAWDRWGAAGTPTLVLCHGYTGSAADFAPVVPALLDLGVQVAILEHRGHGRSGHNPTGVKYRMAELAQDLGVLLAELDEPVHLLGHSMGGWLALQATLDRPELVRSLILMDTSAWSFRSEDPVLAELIAAFVSELDPEAGLPIVSADGPEDELVAAATDPDHLERRQQLRARLDPFAVKQLGEELFVDGVQSLRELLPEVAIPVTVLVGSLDEPFRSQAPELAGLVPDAVLSVLEDAYHSPQLSHPSLWCNAVAAHLARSG